MNGFVKVRLPVRDVDPAAPFGRRLASFQGFRPPTGLAPTLEPLSATLPLGRRTRTTTLLLQQPYDLPFRALFQCPSFYSHDQSCMQLKAPALSVPNDAQILSSPMLRKIQISRVLQNHILPRLTTSPARSLPMGPLNIAKTHRRVLEKPIGTFKLSPICKCLRHGPSRVGCKFGGDVHKAFVTTWVAQFGKRKLFLGPLT